VRHPPRQAAVHGAYEIPWQTLPVERRQRLRELLRRSSGKPTKLPPDDRAELCWLSHGFNSVWLARGTARAAALETRAGRT
jgi:hypothetical protein